MNRKLVSILALLLALSQALAQEDQDILEEMEEEFNILDDAEGNKGTGEEHDITTRILEANQWMSGLLMEGDVALPRGRNAMKCKGNQDCKWEKLPTGLVEVPYRISEYYSPTQKAIIQKAMESFHTKTCIRFVPQTYQIHFIDIMSKEGCWSLVGKTGFRQIVSLNSYGCMYHGIVQHELLHALGFYHEHTRSDRDDYVRINWQNIEAGTSYNFEKMDSNNLNTPYDYSSIMHYSRYAFSTSYDRPTITPIPYAGVSIGQRTELSETDILKVNKLYECDTPK